MSTRRKSDNNLSSSTTVSVSNPSASILPSHLPEEIIFSILKHLPVNSILRFKCVSKDWRSLLSSPNFISIHLQETLKTPLRDSFIIRSVGQTSLFNVNSIEREPVSLVNLFPEIFRKMELVGSINGLMCLSSPSLGQTVILWNPAMNLHKAIRFPVSDENTRIISLGFAYDSVNDDYKIIQIVCLIRNPGPAAVLRYHAQVYSASLDSWNRVHIDLHLLKPVSRSLVTVNGIPYWFGRIYPPKNYCSISNILMYYDMQNGSFKHVSLPKVPFYGGERLVEWKGSLGMLVSSPFIRENCVDILVYDEMGMCWNKISRHKPIGLKMHRPMQCSKDGVILAETRDGKLMLYDPATSGIKDFCFPKALGYFPETFTYNESLVTVKGMEQV